MSGIAIRAGEVPDLAAFLEERIYESNAAATGYNDAEVFSAARVSDCGDIEAGVYGFTWGGCCFVSHLWVCGHLRGKGIGTALLSAVEHHAGNRGCKLVCLSSHSFQAPTFYVRRGYEPVARISDYPVGHADVIFVKRPDRS